MKTSEISTSIYLNFALRQDHKALNLNQHQLRENSYDAVNNIQKRLHNQQQLSYKKYYLILKDNIKYSIRINFSNTAF